MTTFEAKIPHHIEYLKAEIRLLEAERHNLDWGDEGHECDCQYCDRRGEGAKDPDPETEQRAEEIDGTIKDYKHTIASLRAHAAVHKVKLELAK